MTYTSSTQTFFIKFITLLFGIVVAMAIVHLALPAKAEAAYDGARLIDNSVFLDAKSMSASQIQNFLEGKNSGIQDMEFKLDCDLAGTTAKQLYESIDAPCGENIAASRIIYYASQIYGISPKVILATMQKEQSLVTNPSPDSWEINQAMGYDCPTSGHCSDLSGFFWQIDNGTWVLRFHYERARKNMTWWYTSTTWTCGTEKDYYKPNLYPSQNVRFYDQDGVHYRTYYLQTAATSALYCYTPHAYNNPQGLYGREPFGTKGRYYSGSYNFVNAFENWFGSTTGEIPDAIYRLFNKSTNNHLYTTSWNEKNKAEDKANFTYEGVAFYRCTEEGGRPVYRLYNPRNGRHFFTVSAAERDKADKKTNYEYEGVAFRACGDTKVYRLYSSREQKHFYTRSASERDKLVRETSFVYEGTAFTVN